MIGSHVLLDHILLNPLPVRHPDELVQLREVGQNYGSNNGINALSYPRYEDLRDKNQVFSGILCRSLAQLSVTYAGSSERAVGELVSGEYFRVLGVGAALGRLRRFDEFDCPDCTANNPWDEKFGDGDEVRCSYCGEDFKAQVTEAGRLKLKAS